MTEDKVPYRAGPLEWKLHTDRGITRNHRMKCWPHWFDEIAAGRKTFDVRVTDRCFQAGDTLELFKWDPKSHNNVNPMHEAAGSGLFVKVLAVYHDLPGVQPGFCVMSIERVRYELL